MGASFVCAAGVLRAYVSACCAGVCFSVCILRVHSACVFCVCTLCVCVACVCCLSVQCACAVWLLFVCVLRVHWCALQDAVRVCVRTCVRPQAIQYAVSRQGGPPSVTRSFLHRDTVPAMVAKLQAFLEGKAT